MEGLNLASLKLGTSVCCSVPSRDSHPPSNLMEGGTWMVDGFIRPPVSVIVHLPCAVAIRKISWTSSFGEHKSLLHKVYATSSTLPCSSECQKASLDHNILVTWRRVGISTSKDGGVKFANMRLVKDAPLETWGKLSCSEDRWENKRAHLIYLFNFSRQLLDRVTTLQLEICSTEASSVPCMSDLRIEASPAPGQENKESAKQLVLKSKSQGGVNATAPSFSFFGGEEEEQPEVHVVEDQPAFPLDSLTDQPPDFLDSITEEVIFFN